MYELGAFHLHVCVMSKAMTTALVHFAEDRKSACGSKIGLHKPNIDPRKAQAYIGARISGPSRTYASK